jgi:pilus assembly protein CpaE
MAGSGKIRVLIVDDIPDSRDNVAKLLRFEPDVEIVGMAEGGQEGIDLALRLEPDIVLMDINMPGVDGIQATTRIASRLPNTAVIMMSIQSDADYLRRSMLAGAREFLSKPFSLEELIGSIRHVHQLTQANRRVVATSPVDNPTYHSGGRSRRAKVVTVFGLKGGVGRSTVAANLAVALRQRGDFEVALVDGNLLYGDIGVMLNVTDNKTLGDIVKHFDHLDRDLIGDILVTHSSGVKVLLAPHRPQDGEQVTPDHVRQVMQFLITMVDYVVIDTRPSFDEVTLALLDQADRIINVLTLELTAIKGTKNYLEVSELLGYELEKVLLVLNRANAVSGIPVADVAATLKGELAIKLPDDPQLVLRAVNEGVPFVQSAPQALLSQEIDRLAALVIGERTDAQAEAEPALAPAGASRGVSRWIKPPMRRKAG